MLPPVANPSARPIRLWLALASVAVFLVLANLSSSQSTKPKTPIPPVGDPAEEAFMKTPAGFTKPGKPAVAESGREGTLRLTIVDEATGKPTFARVTVVGPDGNYYEPRDHALAPWSLHRLGNRPGKGPSRYYGWFFYCPGEAVVAVPAGRVRIEVWKGYEFRPEQISTEVAAGAMRTVTVKMRRTVPMSERGFYSGDTHIHIERRKPEDDERIFDLLAAEDVETGFLLSCNRGESYTGSMERQLIPQERGFGPNSIARRGKYTISSGQEYLCGTYGHICLMMHGRLVLNEQTVNPNNWPVFGIIADETRKLGGYSFHAHGGYSGEIYVDFARRLTDGVELLQFAEYRGIGLRGWYRMLNIGYRFPALAACDYPYCRALADCRTYVHASAPPSPAEWLRRAADGCSFFTTGPLLFLEVDGHLPGATLSKTGPGPHKLKARVRARCEVAPITRLELIVNGEPVRQWEATRADGQGRWLEFEQEVTLHGPGWIAARAAGVGPTNKPDAEAHTNPVYVCVDGKAPYAQDDLDWLLQQVDAQSAAAQKRRFAEKDQALEFFEKSRQELLRLRKAGGQRGKRNE